MSTIQFIQTTPEQLQELISEGVRKQLQEFLEVYKPQQPNDYLTRSEVCEMLKIEVTTIHNWSKSNILKPRKIGGRVYFLRSEIYDSIVLENQKS